MWNTQLQYRFLLLCWLDDNEMSYIYNEIRDWRREQPKPKSWRWISDQYNVKHPNAMKWYDKQVTARSKTPEQINVLMDKRLKPMKPKDKQKKRLLLES